MSAGVQGALFPVVERGSVVEVFHESGELEGVGTVEAESLGGFVVQLFDGRTVSRPAARVVLVRVVA